MSIENIILLTCILLLIQIFIPILIEQVFLKNINLSYQLSSRDKSIEKSIYFNRGKRALNNLLETLPIFILLIFLSLYKEVENSNLALLWLVFRLLYMPIYMLGMKYIRTILWFGAITCLIMMGIKFI